MIEPTEVKVSIYMLTYNHETFISQAIESVMAQRADFAYELVIGEDCSTDGTRAIVQAYQARYPERIHLLLADHNLGAHQNSIRTLRACRGEYIALLEGDDFWTAPDKLQRQADLLDQHPEWALCFHNAWTLHTAADQAPALLVKPEQKIVSTLEDLLAANFIPACSVMFRRQQVPAFPDWYTTTKLGDWMLHILNAQHGLIGYLPEALATYRIHGRGMWNSLDALQRYQEVLNLYGHLYGHLGQAHASQVTAHAAATLRYFCQVHLIDGEPDTHARHALVVSLGDCAGALERHDWVTARRAFARTLSLARDPHPPATFSPVVVRSLAWLVQVADQWARGQASGPAAAPAQSEPATVASRRLRILHTVEMYAPHVGGCETVVQQLSEYMARQGHAVTVATSHDPQRDFNTLNGVQVEEFRLSGKVCLGLNGPAGEVERYQRFIQNGDFDVVMNYMVEAWTTDLVLPLLPKLRGVKLVFPLGMINRDNAAAPWRAFYAALPGRLRAYDHVIFNSDLSPEKVYGDALKLEHVSTLPNGASAREFGGPTRGFRAQYGITTPHLLFSAATYNNGKRFEFVTRAFREMGRDDTTLVVSGVVPSFAGRLWEADQLVIERMAGWVTPNLKVLHGTPREWMVSGMREADLFLFGSAFEASPVVILESLAAGTPFISTDVGNVRDYACGGEIVDTPQEMAAAANRLLDAPDARARFTAAGQAYWRQNLTWEAISPRLENLYFQSTQPVTAAAV